MFYYADLPVFGQMGPMTQQDNSVHPPIVCRLHCLIDTLPTSDISTIFPVVIVTRSLASKLESSCCLGIEIRAALFEPSDAFRALSGSRPLPEMRWCHVSGKAYHDDFGFADGVKLIVSEKAKTLIVSGKHAQITFIPGDHPPSDEEIDAAIWAHAATVVRGLKAQRKPRTGWFAPPQS